MTVKMVSVCVRNKLYTLSVKNEVAKWMFRDSGMSAVTTTPI